MKTTHTSLNSDAPKQHPSHAEVLARREEIYARMRKSLAEGPLTVVELSTRLNLARSTTHKYLVHLAEFGDVHRAGNRGRANRELWASGREPMPTEEPEDDATLERGKSCATIVPAQQIGMRRDALVVALFGPARSTAA